MFTIKNNLFENYYQQEIFFDFIINSNENKNFLRCTINKKVSDAYQS